MNITIYEYKYNNMTFLILRHELSVIDKRYPPMWQNFVEHRGGDAKTTVARLIQKGFINFANELFHRDVSNGENPI